jgi:hypothetical protein
MLPELIGEGDTNIEAFNIRRMHEDTVIIIYIIFKFTIILLIVSVHSVI